MSERQRIAIVDTERCKPEKCNQECKRVCPPVKLGKRVIEVEKASKFATINEDMCIGCGMCVKKCPFEAIKIVNIPKLPDNSLLHSYGRNSFRIHKICLLKKGSVIGFLGPNGIGKSTMLKILANKLTPNLGSFQTIETPSFIEKKEIVKHFRGTESQVYFEQLYFGDMQTFIKPQHVDQIASIPSVKGKKISEFLDLDTMKILDLSHLSERTIEQLSGGELQRFAIGVTGSKTSQKCSLLFDEPTNYLDIKQRVNIARYIHSLASPDRYIIVCDHDLSILDFISDYIQLFMGEASVYGLVSQLYSAKHAINIYLDGYSPADNMRFRTHELVFRPPQLEEELTERKQGSDVYTYESHRFSYETGFILDISPGTVYSSEVIVMLGRNGTGKSSFMTHFINSCELPLSYKPQSVIPRFEGTVEELFNAKIRTMYSNEHFRTSVINPLGVNHLLQNRVKNLSGGEIQRVAICLTLGKTAKIYLLDEPSAFLDCEQRVIAAYVIKKFIYETQTTAFIVEHDLNMCLYLGDRVITFEGEPGISTKASSPQGFIKGMNSFLKSIDITIRTEAENGRPRINKLHSTKDQEQKKLGEFYSTKTV